MRNKKDTSLDNYGCDENGTVHPDCPKHGFKPTHTPPPWKLDESLKAGCYVRDGEERLIAEVWNETDAAFVVRAVNSHKALLEALKGLVILRDREDVNDTFHEELLAAEKAIAKAEGKL